VSRSSKAEAFWIAYEQFLLPGLLPLANSLVAALLPSPERDESRNYTRGYTFANTIRFGDKPTLRLQQTELAGTCDRFGAPLDLEFAKDFPIVSFHGVQGEEKPLAYLLIRESLSHEVEDF
jgi:hypothetical protein